MKCVRGVVAVGILMAVSGCTTAPAVRTPPATQSQTMTASAAAVAMNYSMIRYADKRIVVFILVDESNFTRIGDQIKADWTKKPNGFSLTRAEAVNVLGRDKTTGVDEKIQPDEEGSELYWATTPDKVKALLREF